MDERSIERAREIADNRAMPQTNHTEGATMPTVLQQERIGRMNARRVTILQNGLAEVEMGWGWLYLNVDGSEHSRTWR
jgi:hypothetical protein